MPKEAPKPDCAKKSGCLWCDDHRDVDSLDYVWSLATFAYLKMHELRMAPPSKRDEDVPPAQLVVTRIHEKLKWFEQSSDIHREWVAEARARVAEGTFHPNFQDEIAELEGSP